MKRAGPERPSPARPERPSPPRHVSGPWWAAHQLFVVAGAGLALAALLAALESGRAGLGLAAVALVAGAGAWLTRSVALPSRIAPPAAFAAVCSAVLVLVVLSCAAYLAAGTFTRVDDALFESVAGTTTTGLSVLEPIEDTPAGVLLWRAMTQWIGGFLALFVVLAVLPLVGAGSAVAERDQGSGTIMLLSSRVQTVQQRLLLFYVGLTAVGLSLFLVADMDLFDAITYAMTTISTGGFANHDASFAYFDSALVEWMGVGGMVLGGANIVVLWTSLRSARPLLSSVEARVYAGLLVGGTVVATLALSADRGFSHGTFRQAAFSVASAVSTTGHWVTDWGTWPGGLEMLVLGLISVGAMSGAVGGGFRIIRAIVLVQLLRREIVRQRRPRAVVVLKVGGQPVDEALVRGMWSYQLLYLLIAAAGAFALALGGADLLTSASATLSALATMGPALGELSPGPGVTELSAFGRLALLPLMLLGRLEIYPVLVGGALLLRRATKPFRRTHRARR